MRMFRPMAVLLMWEAYPPAILAAVGFHAALLYFIIGNGVLAESYVNLDQPAYTPASLVDVNPQKLRKLEQLELKRQTDEKAVQRRRDEAAAAERAQEAQRVKDQEAAARAQTVKQERERTEKLDREAEARREEQEQARSRDREREQARENERLALERAREAEEARQATALREAEAQRQAQAQRQAEQAAADDQNVNAYMTIIRDALASNWSVPPSARNGMLVVLELKLVPTGEIVDYYIGLSSGDDAFDRSALQAIGRVQRFPELQDMPNRLFETQFRTLTIRFRPEDLLR